MCITVIKHIPLPIDTLNAAVLGACGIQPVPFLSTLITYIAIGNNGSAINKRPVRVRTCGITKLMALTGGINKIMLIDLTQQATRCSDSSGQAQEYLIARHAAVETETVLVQICLELGAPSVICSLKEFFHFKKVPLEHCPLMKITLFR